MPKRTNAPGAGRPPELTDPERFSVQVESAVLARLDRYCEKHGWKRSQLLRVLIKRFLDETDPAEK